MQNSIERARVLHKGYIHPLSEFRRQLLLFLMRTVAFKLLAKLDHFEGLKNIPASGPAILMINHIAFIDPIVVMHVVPRNIVPLAKIEVYNYPLIGIVPRFWGVIPVRRDRPAVLAALTAGIGALAAHGLPYKIGLMLAVLAGIAVGVISEEASTDGLK